MGSIFDRINTYAKMIGVRKSKIERVAGLSNGTFKPQTKYLSNNTIDKLKAHFPDLNINWLITGVGSPTKSGKDNLPEQCNTNPQNSSDMDMSFAMDYIATLKQQLEIKDEQLRTKDEQLNEVLRKLPDYGDDKSLSRRLGAVKEKQDKLTL